eukprot:7623803-Lingulodinium_polyedra.AAC.1
MDCRRANPPEFYPMGASLPRYVVAPALKPKQIQQTHWTPPPQSGCVALRCSCAVLTQRWHRTSTVLLHCQCSDNANYYDTTL